MSKIKKDIRQDIDPKSVEKQNKGLMKDGLWVVKELIVFVLLLFLGQVLYALCFTLGVPEARQNMEIFQDIFFSKTVVNQAYYFGHVFVMLCLVIMALSKARSNNSLGKTTIDKFFEEIDWKPLKNTFVGINCFAVGLTMQSVLTTIISLFALLVLGREMGDTTAFYSISTWSIFIIGLVIPIAEELLFRGRIMKRLTQRFDEEKANKIQAVGYAVIHGISAYSVSDFAMGIMFGKMKKMYGTIIAPLLAHIGANALNALLYTFPNLLTYRAFSIVYCIVLVYGAGVLLFLLFKHVWNKTKK